MHKFSAEILISSCLYTFITLYMVQIRFSVPVGIYAGLRGYFLHTGIHRSFTSYAGRITICLLWPFYLLCLFIPRLNNLFCYIWDTEYRIEKYLKYESQQNISAERTQQYFKHGYYIQMSYMTRHGDAVVYYRKDGNASIFRIVAGWLPFTKR